MEETTKLMLYSHLHEDAEPDSTQAQSSILGYSKLSSLLLKKQTTQLFQKFTLMSNILY